MKASDMHGFYVDIHNSCQFTNDDNLELLDIYSQ